MTACTSFLAFFAEQTLAFAVKMSIPVPTAGRKSSDLQAVGQIRWQTEGLTTIRSMLCMEAEAFASSVWNQVRLHGRFLREDSGAQSANVANAARSNRKACVSWNRLLSIFLQRALRAHEFAQRVFMP